MPRAAKQAHFANIHVLLWVCLYSACSMVMLLGNKAVLNAFPYPLTLTCAQLVFATLVTFPPLLVRGFTTMTKQQTSLFVLEGVLFSVSICASLKSLSLTNVGTVVIARSCLPIVVYVMERIVGSKSRLTWRSCLSLLGIVFFGTIYALDAKGVHASPVGVVWVITWLILVALQMVYGKWLVGAAKVTHLERVFYTNTFGLPLLLPVSREETSAFLGVLLPNIPLILLSCLGGVGIGYTSWRLREVVSATTFSLTGVLNKIGTVCLAFILWPDEGSSMSFLALIGTLISGFMYQGTSPVTNSK